MTADEFTAMAERERTYVFRLCNLRLASRHDAEEVMQDTLLKAWTARGRAPEAATDQHRWLSVIARNACTDRLRKGAHDTLPLLAGVTAVAPHRTDDEAITRIELTEALARIAERCGNDRGVFMASLLGYRACEVRMRNGQFKSRVFRARERLRAA